MADSRFARLHNDPRFRRPKKAASKVVVDDRFKAIFDQGPSGSTSKNKKSKAGHAVDKYGRYKSVTHDKEDLRRFYKLETNDDSELKKSKTSNVAPDAQEPKLIDYARGEVLLESSDEDDSDYQKPTKRIDDQDNNSDKISDSSDEDEDDEDETGQVVLGRHISKPIPILANDDDEYDSGDENLEVDLNEDVDNTDLYAELEAQAAAYAEVTSTKKLKKGTKAEAKSTGVADEAEGDDDDASSSDEGDVIKTNRLAVVNLDWDYVRATHLYKIFSSLVSPSAPALITPVTEDKNSANQQQHQKKKGGKRRKDDIAATDSGPKIVRGRILSVRIYPSQFGKERLKKEEVEGPPKEIFRRAKGRDEDDLTGSLIEEDDGQEYNEKALRKYQLERLRYYYAVVTCDTPEAASHIVSELNGTELERSANVFDISYVPDEMSFDDDIPRDEATPSTESSLPNNNDNGKATSSSVVDTLAPGLYKPLDFSTDALRHSRVQLKWDEDDPERNKMTRRTLTKKEIEEGDFRGLIASSSGSEADSDDGKHNQGQKQKQKRAEGDAKSERERLRKLLLGGGRDEMPEGWDSNPFGSDDDHEGEDGGGKAEGDMEITFLPGLSEANANAEETTLEKYKRKQKEKRQARKNEMKEKKEGKIGASEGDENGKKGKKNKKEIDDDFFGEESNSEEEVVEERESNRSKKTKKSNKRGERDDASPEPESEGRRPATEAELELLVAPDDTTESGLHNHFDMKSIIKAEKVKGKKNKFKNKDKKKGKGGEEELQEDFQIDVKDERFKALHEDHTFAIDPSNPHFKKTKSMSALLDERSKRQHTKQSREEQEKPSGVKDRDEKIDGAPSSQSLNSLVESVKRKSSHPDRKGVGKRQRL